MNKPYAMIRTAAATVGTFALGIFAMSGCGSSEAAMPEVIEAYLTYQNMQSAPQPSDTVYDAYFDISDGLLSAYAVPETSNCLESMVNKVTGNPHCKDVYTLKNGEIAKSEKRQTELYNYILDPTSYQAIAPIEETLAQITAGNKAALLVTDFEEYDGTAIQQQNYARKYFNEWLDKGYRIVFFVFDYTEGSLAKHLYFTVFDTPDHLLLKETEDALNGNGGNYRTFRLNKDDVAFSVPYPAVTVGGAYHDSKSGEDIVSCTNETGEDDCYTLFNGLNAEFYPFEESWVNIVQNAEEMKEPGYTPPFTHLISGLKANFERMSGYDVKRLGIRITDIQADYDKFAGYYDFRKNGNNADENGRVLAEFDYEKGGGPVGTVEDMFVIDFKTKDATADIAIDFRPHFSGTVAGMPPTDLLRVDVVIAECEPRYDVLPALFEWTGNRSLVEAVKNTLQEQNPTGRVIYSYFIKAMAE